MTSHGAASSIDEVCIRPHLVVGREGPPAVRVSVVARARLLPRRRACPMLLATSLGEGGGGGGGSEEEEGGGGGGGRGGGRGRRGEGGGG